MFPSMILKIIIIIIIMNANLCCSGYTMFEEEEAI